MGCWSSKHALFCHQIKKSLFRLSNLVKKQGMFVCKDTYLTLAIHMMSPGDGRKILLVNHCSFTSARMDNCRAGAICMQSAIFRGYHLGTHRPIVLKIQAALKNYYYLMRVNPVVPTMQGPIPMPPWRS